jgi:hypothetical protein
MAKEENKAISENLQKTTKRQKRRWICKTKKKAIKMEL